MSDAQKLAALLLHLELRPEELEKFRSDKKYQRAELKHFGVSERAIKVVLSGNLEALGKLFRPLVPHQVATGIVVVGRHRRKK